MDKIKDLIKKYTKDAHLTGECIFDFDFDLFTKDLKNLIDSKWISVEDELPKITRDRMSDVVLSYTKEQGIDLSYIFVNLDKTQTFHHYGFGQQRFKITYWQPLPQPPKEK